MKNILDFIYFFRKKDEKEILRIFGKEKGEKILEILNKIKEKKIEINKRIKISLGNESIEKLKKLFSELPKGISIKYISAPNYQISITSEDYKEANKNMDNFLTRIKEEARKENISVEY